MKLVDSIKLQTFLKVNIDGNIKKNSYPNSEDHISQYKVINLSIFILTIKLKKRQ